MSLGICGAVYSVLTGRQVRYAEDRGALSMVIHVSLSRAASFLDPHSRRGQRASGHFGQARLQSSLSTTLSTTNHHFDDAFLNPRPTLHFERCIVTIA